MTASHLIGTCESSPDTDAVICAHMVVATVSGTASGLILKIRRALV